MALIFFCVIKNCFCLSCSCSELIVQRLLCLAWRYTESIIASRWLCVKPNYLLTFKWSAFFSPLSLSAPFTPLSCDWGLCCCMLPFMSSCLCKHKSVVAMVSVCVCMRCSLLNWGLASTIHSLPVVYFSLFLFPCPCHTFSLSWTQTHTHTVSQSDLRRISHARGRLWANLTLLSISCFGGEEKFKGQFQIVCTRKDSLPSHSLVSVN